MLASSCGSAEKKAERRNFETRAQARQAVASLLRDSRTAEFSEMVILEIVEGHRVVCGKLSMRESQGDIGGPQRFITNGAKLTVLESR